MIQVLILLVRKNFFAFGFFIPNATTFRFWWWKIACSLDE